MSSNGGLAKFNGIDFLEFKSDPEDPFSLPGTFITDVACSSEGKVIISCDYDGVVVYDQKNGNFRKVIPPVENLFNNIAALNLEILNDTLAFLRTSYGKPYLINTRTEKIFELPTDEVIRDVAVDPENQTIAYAIGNNLIKIDLSELKTQVLSPLKGHEIAIDKKGIVWIRGYSQNIVSFNPQTSETKDILMPDNLAVNSDMMLDGHKVWIAKATGCYVYDIELDSWTTLETDISRISSLPTTHCSGLYKDKLNRIWIGHQQGISLIDPNDQLFTKAKQDNLVKYISATQIDESKYLLSAFYKNRIDLLDTNDNSIITIWQKKTGRSSIGNKLY